MHRRSYIVAGPQKEGTTSILGNMAVELTWFTSNYAHRSTIATEDHQTTEEVDDNV